MEDRERLILDKIAGKEFIEIMQLRGVKQIVYETLIQKKGFHVEEVRIDPQFTLIFGTGEATVSIDFMLILEGISFMVIRCVSSGIESWERSVVAFARAINDYQIPYAVVTDGEQAKVTDIIKNVSVRISIQELFTRQEALSFIKDFQKIPYPDKYREKEKRIIYAFEDLKCTQVKRDIS
jgi:hypothetical protein